MRRLRIPVFHSFEDFYKTGGVVDLVVVASPLQYHVDQSCEALQHGSHVLCEKPVAAETDGFWTVLPTVRWLTIFTTSYFSWVRTSIAQRNPQRFLQNCTEPIPSKIMIPSPVA